MGNNPDCLNCADDPIKASKKGIIFCNEACRIRFEQREHF